MKDLTKEESEERIAWFKNWQLTTDERLTRWRNGLDHNLNKELDLSPASLLTLEEYLLVTFLNPKETRDQRNSDLLDAISTYLGEVFIRNLTDNPSWDVELTKTEDPSIFYFYPYLKRENPFIGFNPFYNLIPFAVNKREGNTIANFYNKQVSLYAQKKGSSKIEKGLPGRGGYSYQYFLLIKDSTFELQEIRQTFETDYSKKGELSKVRFYDEKHLLIEMNDNYYFHFQLNEDKSVVEESEEIARNYKGIKSKIMIAKCNSRLEFWGDEDPSGDFINDHLYLLEQLTKNNKCLIFNFRTGQFFDEL